jgi:hypothetical protein
MSFQNSQILSFVSAEAIDGGLFVKLNNVGKIVKCTLATDTPIGVTQRGCESGDAVEVCIAGLTKIIAGDAITCATDHFVMPGLAGKAYKFANGAGAEVPAGRFIPNQNLLLTANGSEFLINFSPALGV